MGKKKAHAEEHENLERWLVSYADFITLLFATFVVLYALAQIDASEFAKLEKSIQQAFAAPSILEGAPAMLDGQGESVLDQSSAPTDSTVAPSILEYVSQKYEDDSFKSIQESLQSDIKSGELKDVSIEMEERGLIIRLKDSNIFFESGTAILNPKAYKALDKIGKVIKSKFSNHLMRIEGHTDNEPSRGIYPSNWELSSARSSSVIRFLILSQKFRPELFSAIGYADIKPVSSNKTEDGKKQNRRVEIVLLRNKYAKKEPNSFALTLNAGKPAPVLTESQSKAKSTVSDAAQQLMMESNNNIIINNNNKAVNQDLYNDVLNFENTKNNEGPKKEKKSPDKPKGLFRNSINSILPKK